ncbi:MAG: hypothetical protein JXM73_14975 [Anaerolineae bacterium]|nr:hypothetical protein [Anaerolineae bacterium]
MSNALRILAVISRDYGQRHVTKVRTHGPSEWTIETWRAPAALPPVLDYPEDFLPDTLPAADLILAFGEHPGVAELLPDIARMTGAQAVIASVDNEAWLPRGLARQLRGWLQNIGVTCVTPICCTTTTPAWPAWVSTATMAIPSCTSLAICSRTTSVRRSSPSAESNTSSQGKRAIDFRGCFAPSILAKWATNGSRA